MSDVNRWTLFSLLSPEFVSSIRFAIVFGSAGNEAIIVTEDDQTYGLGTNNCCCLGIGNGQSALEPTVIEALAGKRVISLSFGSGPHVLALINNGEVFAWGHNGYGQLGLGNTNPGATPLPIVNTLNGIRIIQVSCGNHHSVAVSDRGDVFAWGQNSCGQVGIGNNVNQSAPRRVSGNLSNRFVKGVACGQNSTMAVTSGGELYCWGYNGNGQLGVGNIANQLSPCRVLELQHVVVSQVVCGFAHTLALTDEGDLYAWGSNSCGQLGVNNRTNQLVPIRTATELARVIEVSSIHACNISAAMTQDSKVYMWGQVRGQSVSLPQETQFQCVDDVFACFATPAVCWRPVKFVPPQRNTIQESIKIAFDDPETSDVKIKVEGRIIHAHRAILKIRCQHFRSMFREDWNEANGECVEISQFSYSVYRAFLSYLYTDQVDLTAEDAIGLLDLANSYCEQTLKLKCTEIIKRGITVENAMMLYAAAMRFEAKDLEEYCFQFCLNHMTACTQSEAFTKLDEVAVKHFIAEAAKHGAFKN